MEDWFYSNAHIRAKAISVLHNTHIPVITAHTVPFNPTELSIVELIATAEGSATYSALYHGQLITAHILTPTEDIDCQVDLLIQISILHKLRNYAHVTRLIAAGYLPQADQAKVGINYL